MVAYVAGAAGAIVLSLDIARHTGMSGVATLALLISIVAAVAVVVQFVAFGAAAREQRVPVPDAGPGASAGAATGLLQGLAGYAGLCQRVFVGLLMVWTLLVALGLLAS
jgi:hypothetical protein